jgi:transposase-like protein
MTQKQLFRTCDIRITTDKLQALSEALRDLSLDLDRIRVEVGLLRDANHAMAKTIKERRYAKGG